MNPSNHHLPSTNRGTGRWASSNVDFVTMLRIGVMYLKLISFSLFHLVVVAFRTLTGTKLHRSWTFRAEYSVGIFRYLSHVQDVPVLRYFGDRMVAAASIGCTGSYEAVSTEFEGTVVEGVWISGDGANGQLGQGGAESSSMASRTILYFHGGGYAFGNCLMYLEPHLKLISLFAKRGINARVFSAKYPLAPENLYPSQLEAALATYKWMLYNQHVPAKEIVIAGESAGGNLVMALLVKLRSEPATQPLPLPFAAIPISPMLDLTPDSLSEEPQSAKDLCGPNAFLGVIRRYLGPKSSPQLRASPTVSPVKADAAILQALFGANDSKVKLLLTYGGLEALAPEILRMAERIMQSAEPDAVELDCDKDMPHAYQMLGTPYFGQAAADGLERIVNWCCQVRKAQQ